MNTIFSTPDINRGKVERGTALDLPPNCVCDTIIPSGKGEG